ncbi:hypothetical protein PF005_g18524 [Phytophthora fragariae]|uniref:Uncharacterized protein n=1 Tax=Phytophthora fragariae TaxID=53985 RepID=A0A6A3WWD1_9STRA|nr:hypothetical protein PF003_g18496 [Phytophthora fragariae]KAE8930315.1 hypothetical protein PF009_g19584 [Phytophthora fragariae]KAE9106045.1 hypothetical protein PF006_g21462 [Phytophthora fragariae]KAE9114104.1 hypothetical protein PF007_g10509 [Phytophthora fragariae]KAE9192275.1 hypothetical protein PF005_g18524 [Phytophthora fragariae]
MAVQRADALARVRAAGFRCARSASNCLYLFLLVFQRLLPAHRQTILETWGWGWTQSGVYIGPTIASTRSVKSRCEITGCRTSVPSLAEVPLAKIPPGSTPSGCEGDGPSVTAYLTVPLWSPRVR